MFESMRTEPLFSILIPTWNNLPYLMSCVNSIRRYSTFKHQIIVHVNEGKDGTIEWLNEQKDIEYTHSEDNIGVCHALNLTRTKAHTSYLLYLNDDMIVCPKWDELLWNEVEAIGHHAFFLSSTMIEPFPQSNCSIQADFGKNIQEFDEDALIRHYASFPKQDWNGATWTPNLVHAEYWDKIGGYSVEFSPGMYSDPDFSMKLWNVGVRYFKGLGQSRVYHFGKISTTRITHNPGYYKFIEKWKMSSGTFGKYFLKRGTPFQGPLPDVTLNPLLQFKSFLKVLQLRFRK